MDFKVLKIIKKICIEYSNCVNCPFRNFNEECEISNPEEWDFRKIKPIIKRMIKENVI